MFLFVCICVFLFTFLLLKKTNPQLLEKEVPFSEIGIVTPLSSLLEGNGTGNSTVEHIGILVMENKSYGAVVGSRQAPYINSLIKKYASSDNYFGVTNPSLPNYITLLSGDTHKITTDCEDCFIAGKNFVDQLEEKQLTWKGYMESMPSPCFLGSKTPYAQKHNPFIYFDDIRKNAVRCNNIVPFDQLRADFSKAETTPNFFFISPNLCHDMHDCSVATGDSWLAEHVPQILSSDAFTKTRSLFVITWDEGEGGDNRIPTIVIGSNTKPGFVSHIKYDHYSLLHTLETIWGMPAITNNASQSGVMADLFGIKQ